MADTPETIDDRVQIPELGARPQAIPVSDPSYRDLVALGKLRPAVAYDSFERSTGTDIGRLDSGQPWSEVVGNLSIASGDLLVGDAGGGEDMGLFPLGLQENVEAWAHFVTAAGVKARCALIFRATNKNNLILVQITGSDVRAPNGELELWTRIDGSWAQRAGVQFGGAVSSTLQVRLHVVLSGPILYAETRRIGASASALNQSVSYDAKLIWEGALRRGTFAGVRFLNADATSDQCSWLRMRTF